ncbi:MAG TPA: HAD-IA family hydrolase [Candidatus Acidoferrales bacterium]|nr:HAD-IA family hydrolase [Candidatus Acidoferrales bacterium]
MARRPLIVFDMDGVLVDVTGSYHRTILETVRHFSGKPVSAGGIGRFKSLPGYNDDWKLSYRWIRALGGRARYRDVVRHFQRLYLGRNFRGYIRSERWLLDRRRLRRIAGRAELAVFTGRPRREALYTLERFGVRRWFARIAAMEDVARGKPHPEGLVRLAGRRALPSIVYLGDTADDALAARRAGIRFIGVLDPAAPRRRLRAREMRRLGAGAVLDTVNRIEGWLP